MHIKYTWFFFSATRVASETQLFLDRTAQISVYAGHYVSGAIWHVSHSAPKWLRDDAAEQEKRSAVVLWGQTMEDSSELVRILYAK